MGQVRVGQGEEVKRQRPVTYISRRGTSAERHKVNLYPSNLESVPILHRRELAQLHNEGGNSFAYISKGKRREGARLDLATRSLRARVDANSPFQNLHGDSSDLFVSVHKRSSSSAQDRQRDTQNRRDLPK